MITIVQPALPAYRMGFFDALHRHFGPAFKVFYSPGSLGALTQPVERDWAVAVGPFRRWFRVVEWQPSIASLPVARSDIVVLSGNPRQLSTLVLLLRARLKGARTIWWSHYWSSTSKRWRQLLRFLPLALSDAALFYTDLEVEQAYTDPMFPSKRVILAALYNGIDLEPIRPLRRPYDLTERENAALFIGRLTPKANLGLALEAMVQLGARAPVLHIVGDGDLKLELAMRAQSLGLSEKVVWHGAITDEAEIAKVANRCKLFLYPGEVGLSLIHAMAYTLPAIVHDRPRLHMPEIAAFRDGATGLSFAHGDPRALARTIEAMLSDAGKLDRFAAAAAGIVGPSYTTQDMADRFAGLVDRLEEGR